jgi:hypothetical protein
VRKTVFALVIVFVIVVIVGLLKTKPQPLAVTEPEVPVPAYIGTPAEETAVSHTPTPEETVANLKLAEAAKIQGATISEKIKNTKLINVSEYREEVKKNPHATPLKFVESALKLGTLFDNVKSENDAIEVFTYFKDCLSSDAPSPLKVTCYNYSKKMAQAYPALKKDFDPLYPQLDPEVKKVVDLGNNVR